MSSFVSCSHALVSGPTRKRPSSEGGLCRGQAVMMWLAVCSGSPHSHAGLSVRPHFFIGALKQPTPVRRRFRRVHCRRGRSSPSAPSPGSRIWWCMRVCPADSHSCFHAAASQALVDRSSGMEVSISWAAKLYGWRDLSLLGGVAMVVVSWRRCQSCSWAFLARARVAASRRRPAQQLQVEATVPHGVICGSQVQVHYPSFLIALEAVLDVWE